VRRSTDEIDIAIVGAGPAGLMAAIEAARRGLRPTVLEALPEPGRKLLASGGGRCNLTNTLEVPEMARRFPEHRRFVEDVLRSFPPQALREWLAGFGVETHAPDGYRVFPTTHQSGTVLEALLGEAKNRGVEIRLNWPVSKLEWTDGFTAENSRGDALRARRLLVACGGVGYPGLGDGSRLWELLRVMGHTVSSPLPGMVPLTTREEWPSRCRADTLPRVELTLCGKKRTARVGDLIFTRSGMAGPVVLDASREVSASLRDHGEVPVRLRLREGWSPEEWRSHLQAACQQTPSASLGKWLEEETAPSLAAVALEVSGAEASIALGQLARSHRMALADWLGGIPLTVTGTAGFEQAMVTRGGLSLREVAPRTLESRKVPGLHFAGEVLDVDGPCGGYNLQWAFATGHRVGSSLA